jgi:hypothetical protein
LPPRDFKSLASAYSATPAWCVYTSIGGVFPDIWRDISDG